MGRTACTEPQCLYKGDLYLYLWSWKSRAIPLLSLWAVRPVQSLSACTRVHFTFTLTLWKWQWTFGSRKMRRISWLYEEVSASQEGLCTRSSFVMVLGCWTTAVVGQISGGKWKFVLAFNDTMVWMKRASMNSNNNELRKHYNKQTQGRQDSDMETWKAYCLGVT